MDNQQFHQLSPEEISYPQFQSSPTYNLQPHLTSQLPQYFNFEDTWSQPPSYNSPPGPFLLPSDGQYCPGADWISFNYNLLHPTTSTLLCLQKMTAVTSSLITHLHPTTSTTPCLQKMTAVTSSLITHLHPTTSTTPCLQKLTADISSLITPLPWTIRSSHLSTYLTLIPTPYNF